MHFRVRFGKDLFCDFQGHRSLRKVGEFQRVVSRDAEELQYF